MKCQRKSICTMYKIIKYISSTSLLRNLLKNDNIIKDMSIHENVWGVIKNLKDTQDVKNYGTYKVTKN